jgi:hypothetical protein
MEGGSSANGVSKYETDVFVSYCDADEEWAFAELIKPMLDAGLKVTSEEDFDLGLPKIEAHSRAVERSRKIVIVATPRWCESQWGAFDATLAQSPDPSGIFPRLIPLILQPCKLPPRLSSLVSADFTDPRVRKEQFARLLRNLGKTAREINEVTTNSVKQGIRALSELLGIRTVQDSLRSYEESFAHASESIGVLGRYKRLHDYFQRVDGAYKMLLRSRKASSAPESWDEIEEDAGELASELEQLLLFARNGSFLPDEILWTGRLDRMSGELKAAARDHDDAKVGEICERLLKVLSVQPGRINARLVQTAGQLALGDIAEKLRKIPTSLGDVELNEQARARLEEFTRGIDSLGRLDQSLRALINNHNCLQEIDDSLRSFEMNLRPSPDEIAYTWTDLAEPLGKLNGDSGASWLPGLRELGKTMDAFVARPPTEPKAVREFQSVFREVRVKINVGFNQTDEDLRRFCEQLQKVGDDLKAAIGRMQRD